MISKVYMPKCNNCGKECLTLVSTDSMCSDSCRNEYWLKQPCNVCGKTSSDKHRWYNDTMCYTCGLLYKEFLVYSDKATQHNKEVYDKINDICKQKELMLPEYCMLNAFDEIIFIPGDYGENNFSMAEMAKIVEKSKTVDINKIKELNVSIRDLQKSVIYRVNFTDWLKLKKEEKK